MNTRDEIRTRLGQLIELRSDQRMFASGSHPAPNAVKAVNETEARIRILYGQLSALDGNPCPVAGDHCQKQLNATLRTATGQLWMCFNCMEGAS